MKKLISSLMAITLVSSIAGSVTSCSVRMSKINLSFTGAFNTFPESESDTFNSFNGTNVTPYYSPGSNKTSEMAVTKILAKEVLNLLGFNHTLVTQPKEVANYRNTFVGQDAHNESLNFTPSVDGVFYGEKFEKFSQADFYKTYDKTTINSLEGLHMLYEYASANGDTSLGKGAKQSYEMISQVMTTDAGKGFFNSFLSKQGKIQDSAWTSWNYIGQEAPTKLNSRILSYNMEVVEPTKNPNKPSLLKDNKINQFQLTPEGKMKDLGSEVEYSEVNTSVKDEKDGKIGNDKKNPYDLNLFTLENPIGEAKFNINKNWNPAQNSDEINGRKTWEIRQGTDPNAWDITATDQPLFDVQTGKNKEDKETKEQSWTNGFIKTNSTVLVKVKPLKIRLTYSTNVRKGDAKKYDLEFTLNGLTAAFEPFVRASSFKDADKDKETIGNRFVKWQFSHYQFTDANDTWINTEERSSKDPNNGFFSQLQISDLKVEDHSNE
ncbi:hypothetical protein JN01_0075 [Entomoplasma freundtii]|uniref:Uncharacterized protein n=1 Tax=Entomoplasma freundtii TaxID=74700 RepID=A0A2K8NVP2_9MOLU|nr:hypothetical protein [Entomoplasma freundtii]ATZ16703.1 hypothetical protein EFREU_v1c06830 [Entomoplasma freundtii]TDY58130.1 hypothetical protein JN01_0075 [Entomoplasma freundtii]